jgi:hypothetical protein
MRRELQNPRVGINRDCVSLAFEIVTSKISITCLEGEVAIEFLAPVLARQPDECGTTSVAVSRRN